MHFSTVRLNYTSAQKQFRHSAVTIISYMVLEVTFTTLFFLELFCTFLNFIINVLNFTTMMVGMRNTARNNDSIFVHLIFSTTRKLSVVVKYSVSVPGGRIFGRKLLFGFGSGSGRNFERHWVSLLSQPDILLSV